MFCSVFFFSCYKSVYHSIIFLLAHVGRRVQGGWSRFSVLSSNSSSSLSLLFPFNSSSSSSLSDSPVPPPPPPRVFCFILTHNKSLASRAKAVALTWAPSCDKAIFISDQFTASTPHNHPLQPFEAPAAAHINMMLFFLFMNHHASNPVLP